MEEGFERITKYILNSLIVDSPEMKQICDTAKETSTAVVLGFSERSGTSVYIAQAIISPQGEILMTRRKIKPTHQERTVFGDGSGNDLNNVVEIDFGGDVGKVKIGCLNCWEHTQPLLKYHTYTQGPMIHVSMWPPVDPHGGVDYPGLYSMTSDGVLNLSQVCAMEGTQYVLHCTAVCAEKGIEAFSSEGYPMFGKPGGGNSAVIGPDGRILKQTLKSSEEGIIFADLDLTKVIATRSFLDVVGHYSRPDLLWLGYDNKAKPVKRNGVEMINGHKA